MNDAVRTKEEFRGLPPASGGYSRKEYLLSYVGYTYEADLLDCAEEGSHDIGGPGRRILSSGPLASGKGPIRKGKDA